MPGMRISSEAKQQVKKVKERHGLGSEAEALDRLLELDDAKDRFVTRSEVEAVVERKIEEAAASGRY